MGILPGVLQNYNLLRFVRNRHPHRLSALPQIGGAAPPAGYDYLIKQPYDAATPGVILPVGAGGAWDNLWAAQHSIVLSSGTYYHYYTGSQNGTTNKIGVATSSDGLALTKSGSNPILSGTAATWDSSAVGNPNVWIEGSTWHMLYGGNNGTTWGVGHATSSDGTTWTKDSANPVMSSTGSAWDSAFIFPSSIMKVNGIYWLYYWGSTSTSDQTTYAIGLATAVNPSGPWTKHPLNPLLVGETSGGVWDAGVLDPQVLIRGGMWLMLFQGNTSEGAHSATGIAWSTDGIHWVRDTNNPRMTFRNAGSWFDSAWGGEIPHAFQVGSDWYVYWNGSNGTSPKAQGGYAIWQPFGTVLSTLFTNLQANYELNNTVQDSSDNGFHGSATSTSNGAAGSGPGGVETALTFTAATPSRVTANSQTAFQPGSGDFCISVFVYITSAGGTSQFIIAKYNPVGGGHEWFLSYNGGTSRYRFGVSTDGSADITVDATSYGAPATSTWTHILAWIDHTNNNINICVNDGTVNSTSYSATPNAGSAAIHIGDLQTEILGWGGRLAQVRIFKSATAGGAIPSTTQRTWLYNSGSGRTYKELPTAP